MELVESKRYNVEVIKLLERGIIVQFEGTSDTEFIHISKLSHEFVSKVSDIVEVGDKFNAVCVAGFKPGHLELSIKDAGLATKKSKSLYKNVEKEAKREPAHDIDAMIAESSKVFNDKRFAMDARLKRRRRRS